MRVKQQYDDFEEDSYLTGLDCQDKSLAVQSMRDETDINTIVRRFGLTGQLPSDLATPQYGDYSEVFDFHTAMNVVAEANEAFMRMPADLRYRFGNDPQQLLEFISNERNWDEAKKLGLLIPGAERKVEVAVVPPVPAK